MGVGFDTLAADGKFLVTGVNKEKSLVVEIEDSREGWVDSVGSLIDSYFDNGPVLVCDKKRKRLK